ncbi:MAG: hypothetical protein OEV55_03495 [candidate division Zixibacteria bacterium]|nr:hypothetical protein [candidate division Zixibacteria bacterium]
MLHKTYSWRKALKDPVYFAREFLEIEPHPGQASWLSNSIKPENALHTGNRWGKSLCQAIKIMHHCIFKIRKTKYNTAGKYTAVNVSITLDQARIILDKATGLLKGKRILEPLVTDIKQTPFPHIIFSNTAVFWARSSQRRGEYLLGHDYDYCNFDEVAFEPHPEYVVNNVIMMRLCDRGGILDYTSTPRGKNWFYRKCLELKSHPEYGYVQSGDTRENPYISTEYMQRKLKTLSQSKIEQNIIGNFIDDPDQVIEEKYISQSTSLSGGLSLPRENHQYSTGWDLARKRAYTVGITLDVTSKPYQLVCIERFQRDWKETFEAIRRRKKEFGGEVLIDSTGLGDVVVEELKDINARGFNFGEKGGKARSELIANLQKEHALGNIAYPYIELPEEDGSLWSLQDELRNFTWDTREGCDAVMALALALWNVRRPEQLVLVLEPRVERI